MQEKEQQGFQNLKVWEKGHKLVLLIYHLTDNFPKHERFGITQQIRRSSVSICANIAEGHRKTRKDFLRFLDIAQGSLEETKYYIILSHDLTYHSLNLDDIMAQINEIGRMLTGLSKSIRSKIN
jgi:four helix bundle protein